MVDRDRARPVGPALGLASVVAIILALCTWTGGAGVASAWLWTALASAPYPCLWLASAIGLGTCLGRWLVPDFVDGAAVAAALGIAAMLFLDGLLARLGVLGSTIGAWAALAPGLVALLVEVRRAARRPGGFTLPHWLAWSAAPAVAVLAVAACSAPGWLWASEFGGYDALSYHLQLPKEWMALGRLAALEHNVYSHFPSSMEAAYMHLMVLSGDALGGAYACQMLHAALAVVAAWTTGVVARRLGPSSTGAACGAAAFVIVIGTPWVVVTGSLAYDEMAVLVMLAAALLVLDGAAAATGTRRAIALGILAGAACGAKLTAIGFVVAPVAALLAWDLRRAPLAAARSLAVCAVALTLSLAPWLVSNAVATGNPVFPFLTGAFGTGHWSAEQAAIWSRAHFADLSAGGRLGEGWHQLMRYGLGTAPDALEPWQPQWSLLPWLALVGAVVSIAARFERPRAVRAFVVVAIQVVFWLVATHVKSRFMLPAVVPAALLVAGGGAALAARLGPGGARRIGLVAAALALAAHASVTVLVFSREAQGRPAAAVGGVFELSGAADAERLRAATLSGAERAHILSTASPPYWINNAVGDRGRALFVGEATAFYYDGDRMRYQTTWDRGPLSVAMDEHPDDPAAWIESLRRSGFTHVLVNREMLRRWSADGWGDPGLTPERVLDALDRFGTLVADWPWGVSLHRLERTP